MVPHDTFCALNKGSGGLDWKSEVKLSPPPGGRPLKLYESLASPPKNYFVVSACLGGGTIQIALFLVLLVRVPATRGPWALQALILELGLQKVSGALVVSLVAQALYPPYRAMGYSYTLS